MAVIRLNMYSEVLHRNNECIVIVPDKLRDDETKLKTIWMYHGGSGDHTQWLYNIPLTEYVNDKRFVAVLPNAHESCFVDMNYGDKYAKYVGEELPQMIHSLFNISSEKREDNYIVGYSNGGYGALHTALMYPQNFYSVGAFSAGDKADSDFPQDGSPKYYNRIKLFGDGDLNKNSYGLKYLAYQMVECYSTKPVIYHACGGQDPWLRQNHIVRDYFLNLNDEFDYTYDEIPEGAHDWKFWNEELLRYMDIIDKDIDD